MKRIENGERRKMTIDEAIQRYTDNAEYERTHDLQGCLEFTQLVKWMKELKQLREVENNDKGRNN